MSDRNQSTPGEWRTTRPASNPALRRFGRVAVVGASLVLIALTWFGIRDAIIAHNREASARVQAELLGKAGILEEQLRRELLSLDQTLRILEYEWERDPDHFDLATRSLQVVVINDVALQLFIADAQGIVRSSTRPAIVGTDIGRRDYFRHEAALPADDGQMYVGSLVQGQVTRQWQINLARRLDAADKKFAGVLAASYDASALTRFGPGVDTGTNGIIGVVSMRDAEAWTLVGSTQRQNVFDLTGTPIFTAMGAADHGVWRGRGPDGVDRIYAFSTIPDRGLRVLVGLDNAEAMGASVNWERDALAFATGITVLLLLLAWLLLRAINAAWLHHEDLSRERAILTAALSGMSDGIMMVDGDLRLIAWNQHFPEFTGISPDILRVGLPMEEMLRNQVAAGEFGAVDVEAEVARRMSILRAGGSVGTIERQRPGGRQLEIRRDSLPGGGFVTLYRDVTARRQAEERMRQAQTMAAIGRLTAGVAHDFNNLLISITGNAEMLHEQLRDDPEHARRLSTILQSAERGADLVRRLLAFARQQSLTPVEVDLNKLVRGMGDLLRVTLGRSIRVETKLGKGLWPALVDPVQVEHVILNLAINARDAMPRGGTLTISTTNTALDEASGTAVDLLPGDYVMVAVGDNGTGMNEEVMRNAFEPFFTTKPPGKGSGLGLSQVYGLANQSGGGVRIESRLGVGTTVSVLFPRAQTAAASHVNDVKRAGAGSDTVQKWHRTIMVVDDETERRESIGAVLGANGFEVLLAENGKAALRLVDEGAAFDLLLVNFDMSDMDGAEVARAVRLRRQAIPAIFLTDGEEELTSGERWVVTKPFVTRNLVRTLRAALGLDRDGEPSM